MVVYNKNKILTKRVPTVVDFTDNIQRWDTDNLYPQRALEVIKRAYPLKQALDTFSDFINGDGFVDDTLGKLIVNHSVRQGQSMDHILRKLSIDVARFKAFVLHVNYNLNYRISSIEVKPIEHFRFGHPDSNGEYHEIFHSLNWERDARKLLQGDRIVTSFPLFNPNPDVVALQVEKAGGIYQYKGQIYFVSMDPIEYPLATFDAVWEHAEAVGESALAKISAIKNGFGGTIAVVYPGNFESPQERADFQNYIENKSGARGTNSIIGIEDKGGFRKANEMFVQLAPPNVDRLWEYTETSAAAAILENYAQPKELQGVRPESGMFNQENMIQAYIYYNSRTRNIRLWITEVIGELMLHFGENTMPIDARIRDQAYTINGQPVLPSGPNNDPSPPANTNIQNMTGRQRQGFKRVLRDFHNGITTRAQAESELKGFGLTENDISIWLNTEENGN